MGQEVIFCVAKSNLQVNCNNLLIFLSLHLHCSFQDAIAKNSFYDQTLGVDEGDMDKAMAEADEIVTGTVDSHAQEHLYLEPQTALCVPKVEQKELDIYSSTQSINEQQVKAQTLLDIENHNFYSRKS